MKRQYDAIIIGFGKGGKTLAAELANRDWNVAVIEKSEKMYGGTCINIGCIPTKSLVHHSKMALSNNLQNAGMKKEFYKKSIHEKEQLVSFLRNKNFDNLEQHDNITIYTGEGSFISKNEIKITSGKHVETIVGDKIFINTGASSVIPPIKGLVDSRYVHTSTSIMEADMLPKELVIIGGGYIGLEFASIYSGFGANVTILEGSEQLIPREDRDIADLVRESLEKKGVIFKLGASVESVYDEEKAASISYKISGEQKEIKADAILVATGRKPNTHGLHLENAGVKIDNREAVIVNDYLETTAEHIWAMGDVKGGLQFTYISLDDYRIIIDSLFGKKIRRTKDRVNVPYSVFIDPPLSRVGLSEEEAREQGYDPIVGKLPVAAIPRARIINETDGLLKAVVDRNTKKILGCTLFCPESTEMINNVSIAMKTGQDYTFLRDHIFTHPTMSEALNDLFASIK
ncbi:FAD-dependent oxidoreductase [Bacillus sp. 1P06AnD]|uniref:FAD-dependent oxidoreductase n=1 Tax=Bacillus sp. 1P06AnD TaxID=3132208 RepID=UPI0039A24404